MDLSFFGGSASATPPLPTIPANCGRDVSTTARGTWSGSVR
jgi:hypothetical protein